MTMLSKLLLLPTSTMESPNMMSAGTMAPLDLQIKQETNKRTQNPETLISCITFPSCLSCLMQQRAEREGEIANDY